MAPRQKPFASEVDLCKRFIDAVDREAWDVYPETAGWDILLSRKSDGCQIGIEAKLKFNAYVLCQALEESGWQVVHSGPDFRAVLVPDGEGHDLGRIAAYIGLTVIRCYPEGKTDRYYRSPAFLPYLPLESYPRRGSWNPPDQDWYDMCPVKRHTLPEFIPDVDAGASAPVQLTDWKIKAIKIAVLLETKGYVTRHDFKHVGIDHRRWIARESGWLTVDNKRYVRGDSLPDFKSMHPRNYTEIAAAIEKWKPPELMPLEKPKQLFDQAA